MTSIKDGDPISAKFSSSQGCLVLKLLLKGSYLTNTVEDLCGITSQGPLLPRLSWPHCQRLHQYRQAQTIAIGIQQGTMFVSKVCLDRGVTGEWFIPSTVM